MMAVEISINKLVNKGNRPLKYAPYVNMYGWPKKTRVRREVLKC